MRKRLSSISGISYMMSAPWRKCRELITLCKLTYWYKAIGDIRLCPLPCCPWWVILGIRTSRRLCSCHFHFSGPGKLLRRVCVCSDKTKSRFTIDVKTLKKKTFKNAMKAFIFCQCKIVFSSCRITFDIQRVLCASCIIVLPCCIGYLF